MQISFRQMRKLSNIVRLLAFWITLIGLVGIVVLPANDFSGVHARRPATLPEQATAASCGVQTFGPVTNLNAGTLPVSVAAADFNGDGRIDLAVANFGSNSVSIFLNNGSGGFGAPTDYAAGTNPSSIVAADFNGDGKIDLAVTDSASDTVSILLGNGNGGFGAPAGFPTGADPSAIVASDLDGDGKLDLAIANADTNDISILLGNGSGGFKPTPNIAVGSSPVDLAVGDFNGDGKKDLAVANFTDNSISILLGDGRGGFVRSTDLNSNTNPVSIVVDDFNGDGKNDLAVANAASDNVAVFLGNGAGNFAGPAFYDAGLAPNALGKGDLNGDGKVDLIVANGNSDDISVLLNDGSGGFLTATNFNVGISPSAFAVADLDGDGRLDLAVPNADSNNVSILLNTCGLAPAPTTIQFSTSSYTVGEGDQRVNIAVTRAGYTSGAASVGYATIDDAGLQNCNVFNGIASPRCDYETTIGTLSFAAGETSKSFSVAIIDDSYAEGNETFRVSLNNPSGAILGSPSIATVTIIDNDTVNGPNPIDNTNFFVGQQYLDFLGREPDPGGFASWVGIINGCAPADPSCDRVHVSQNFFQSEEFQSRGYFVYRFYPVAFGRKPDYAEFVTDLARVSGFLDASQLEAAKVAFIAAFMARPAFANQYNGLSNASYVDALINTAQVNLSNRQSLIDGLNGGTLTRAQVLRQIVESAEVSNKYNHQAFAVMEYFGYLRRDPDSSYLVWIQVLDQTNDPRGMVTGFVNSLEYRQRFGP